VGMRVREKGVILESVDQKEKDDEMYLDPIHLSILFVCAGLGCFLFFAGIALCAWAGVTGGS